MISLMKTVERGFDSTRAILDVAMGDVFLLSPHPKPLYYITLKHSTDRSSRKVEPAGSNELLFLTQYNTGFVDPTVVENFTYVQVERFFPLVSRNYETRFKWSS